MKQSIAAIVSGCLFGAVVSILWAQTPKTSEKAALEPAAGTAGMREPRACLLLAEEDLSEKDFRAADAEIRRAEALLKREEKRPASD